MQTEVLIFEPNGWVPNNPARPVLIYRAVRERGDCETTASAFEALFASHGWLPGWRDTVFDYHHYHSTAHEVLGISRGSACLMLGGPGGRTIEVTAGDAIVVPVGVGHCRVDGDTDFLVVGAYPAGYDWDICREAPSEAERARILALPIPHEDPVEGRGGTLVRIWNLRYD